MRIIETLERSKQERRLKSEYEVELSANCLRSRLGSGQECEASLGGPKPRLGDLGGRWLAGMAISGELLRIRVIV